MTPASGYRAGVIVFPGNDRVPPGLFSHTTPTRTSAGKAPGEHRGHRERSTTSASARSTHLGSCLHQPIDHLCGEIGIGPAEPGDRGHVHAVTDQADRLGQAETG